MFSVTRRAGWAHLNSKSNTVSGKFRLIKNPDAIRRQISVERVRLSVHVSVTIGVNVHMGDSADRR